MWVRNGLAGGLSAALVLLAGTLGAAEVLPPAPKAFFNDYAGVVSRGTAARLNQRLEDFERETSNQILAVVYPKMESDSSIEDYTVRVAQSWRAGQKGRDNGAVLFVFIADRKMYLQVGYGLEGALPDITAKRIIEDEIKPRFRAGDFDGGLSAGVEAIMAATRGEYKGSGQVVGRGGPSFVGLIVVALVLGLFGLMLLRAIARGSVRWGGHSHWGGWTAGSGGWSSSGGGWSGGGWGGSRGGWGGGGGFSGGGGSFGGGGAGGSW